MPVSVYDVTVGRTGRLWIGTGTVNRWHLADLPETADRRPDGKRGWWNLLLFKFYLIKVPVRNNALHNQLINGLNLFNN